MFRKLPQGWQGGRDRNGYWVKCLYGEDNGNWQGGFRTEREAMEYVDWYEEEQRESERRAYSEYSHFVMGF